MPEAHPRRRLIFCVTTGRSGTGHLAWVLGGFRQVKAAHEPKPKFSDAFGVVRHAPETAREFWLSHKLPRLRMGKQPIYAETSHLACKGFLRPLTELGIEFDLIHLHRPHRAVATSLLALGTIPGRSYRGWRYYLAPTDNVLRPLAAEVLPELTDYQLCFWYCLEVEARAAMWRRDCEQLKRRFHSCALDELLREDGVRRLGQALDLGPWSPRARFLFERRAARRRNAKTDRKAALVLSAVEMERQEQELRERLAAQSSE